MSFWLKLGQFITKTAALLAVVPLLIMMAIVTSNVIGRGLFGSPVLGTVELVGLTGIFLISFAIGLTERDRAHITIKIMVSRFSPRLRSLFAIFSFILSIAAVVLLFWAGVLQLWDAVVRPGMVTDVLGIPKAPFVGVWICGCLFLLGYFLKNLASELIGRGKT